MTDTRALLNRWVIKHGVEGEYITELTFHVLNGGTIDGYHEEQRRANDMGRVLEEPDLLGSDRDVAVLD